MATLVLAAFTQRDRVLSASILADDAPRTVRRVVQAAVDETFSRLAAAFADVDRPA